ncbi:MarR family winged helix-turn-helix transcriptional regulator [Actinocorallia populi]|uniref:MarR family winged helix-turn-helix transcriptional regulator n=1 Tax=Actinocorallia populi TaxID=2079200 RepID=UPI001300380D|nr:MarR family transcriptional regulator [Actinocorallia populi]
MERLDDERCSLSRDGARSALERLLELTEVTAVFVKRGLTERGLSRARASVLWVLHHRGPVTQRELSDVVGVTPRNITGLVDALETDDYVTRRRHPNDRRAMLVSLTAKGTETMNKAQEDFSENAFHLFFGLPPQELDTFLKVSGRLIDRVRGYAGACHDDPERTSPLS